MSGAENERDLQKLKSHRLICLLEDILSEAENHPQRLTAFNSPLLGLAMLEVYQHNHPDADVSDEQAKFRSVVEARRKQDAGI